MKIVMIHANIISIVLLGKGVYILLDIQNYMLCYGYIISILCFNSSRCSRSTWVLLLHRGLNLH